jgi:molybdopterin converting factor small subunit
MRVRVRYFAIFREAAGVEAELVETGAADTTGLFAEMTARHAGLHEEPAALVAINDEMAGWDSPIRDGDEVLFFPPVAGG